MRRRKLLRVVLSPSALARARSPEGVAVRRSAFGGLGVFTTRARRAGETVCWFHGRPRTARDALVGTAERAAQERYQICGGARCLVPLHVGALAPPPLPALLSGCRINEASARPEGDYRANVEVQEDEGSSVAWPVRALRPLVAGEELLLCYGPAYGPRGYQPACERALDQKGTRASLV